MIFFLEISFVIQFGFFARTHTHSVVPFSPVRLHDSHFPNMCHISFSLSSVQLFLWLDKVFFPFVFIWFELVWYSCCCCFS